jgi:phosphoserine phosphatase RsbU/P
VRIFIAEDDPVSRLMLQAVLKKSGHEVTAAEDGGQALAALSLPDAPRLAILDVMMPVMDGVEVCRRLRALPGGGKQYLIMLTAMNQSEHVVNGLSAGANDYVSKPFVKEELLARVRAGERMIELQEALEQRVTEVENALAHIRTLQGILPICMHCHKIRNDSESWQRLEIYLEEHSDAQFSHGLCPECLEKHYPDV